MCNQSFVPSRWRMIPTIHRYHYKVRISIILMAMRIDSVLVTSSVCYSFFVSCILQHTSTVSDEPNSNSTKNFGKSPLQVLQQVYWRCRRNTYLRLLIYRRSCIHAQQKGLQSSTNTCTTTSTCTKAL